MAVSTKCMSKANDEGFQRRVKYFMQKSAIAVIGEDEMTEHHTERVAYAKLILDGTASVYEYSVGVVTNATIATAIDGDTDPTDSDIEFVVNSMFNDFAGAD